AARAGGDRDAEIAPVAHAGRRSAVHELGAMTREQAGGLMADHAPVADRVELGALAQVIDRDALDHALDMTGMARVFDVEEDGVAGRGGRSGRGRGGERGG